MKNLALMAGFNTMMIRYSGLLFWATLYTVSNIMVLVAVMYFISAVSSKKTRDITVKRISSIVNYHYAFIDIKSEDYIVIQGGLKSKSLPKKN